MKKLLFSFLFLFLIIYSCFFPEITLEASKNGLLIWFHQILPALLPFTILSTILINSYFLESFSGNANIIAIMLTMVCGFVFGFPIGAKLASDFYQRSIITDKQATILSITANNFSPMYVCGFALPALFSTKEQENYNLIFISYLLVYFIPLIIATIYLIVTYRHISPKTSKQKTTKFHLDMQVVDIGITHGFLSLIKLCGYIVLFSVFTQIIISIIDSSNIYFKWLLENIEITNGIELLKEMKIKLQYRYIIFIQILSLGGISGLAQSASFLKPSKLSVHKYIIGKVILSLLVSFIATIYVL